MDGEKLKVAVKRTAPKCRADTLETLPVELEGRRSETQRGANRQSYR